MTSALDIPVFVINLERDLARRAYMQESLSGLGIECEFVSAVDGSRLHQTIYQRYDQKRCLRIYGVDMIPAEVGCYLSHYNLYERMVAERIETALILEDDVTLLKEFPEVVNALLELKGFDWKVVRLTTLRPKVERPASAKFYGQRLAHVAPGYDFFRLRTHVLGAGAYLINQFGARSLIEYGRNFFMPIDHTMDRFWENGIVPYVVRPFPAHQRQDLVSSIGMRDPRRRHRMPLQLRLERRAQRLQDSFQKRLFNMLQ